VHLFSSSNTTTSLLFFKTIIIRHLSLILKPATISFLRMVEDGCKGLKRLRKLRKASGALGTPNSPAISTRTLVFVASCEISHLREAVAKKKPITSHKASLGKAKPTPSDGHQPGLCILLYSGPLKRSPSDSSGSRARSPARLHLQRRRDADPCSILQSGVRAGRPGSSLRRNTNERPPSFPPSSPWSLLTSNPGPLHSQW